MKLNVDRLLRPLLIGLLVVTSIWLAATIISRRLPPSTPEPNRSPMDVPPECSATLTHGLLARGVSATVQFTPQGILRVTIPYRRSPGTPPDEGAQLAWTIFDAAAALPSDCTFRRLEVTVETGDLHIQAAVAGETLQSWAQGRLDEEAFIDQVTYTEATPESSQP